MRVLIFSTAYFPFVGGAEIAVKEITDRIPDIEFDLITAKLSPRLLAFERIGRVNVHRIGVGIPIIDKVFFLPFVGAVAAWNLNRERKYDAFWCIMATYASGAGYIFNIWRKLTGQKEIPIILTLQEGDSEEHLTNRWGGILNLSWELALARTKILTVISNYLGERADRLGFRGETVLIPNGVDTALFSKIPSVEDLETLKATLKKGPEDIFLVTTSRLNVKNAIGDVIDSLVFLPENVKFLVIGAGELEENLKDQTKKLHLENRVLFLGLIEYKNIPLYLHVSDIFIRPSLSEGMGNSFIEAMASGLPVIATPVGGIVDFLIDPEKPARLNGSSRSGGDHDMPPTGLFVNVHDPKNIAIQVKRLIEDKELRNKLIQNAEKLVKEKYEWDLVAKDMKERVFDKLKL